MKIYSKGGVVLADVSDYPYSGVFVGERFVSYSFKTDRPIDFLSGDYLIFRGESFVLDYTPTAKKISSAGSTGDAFQYDLKFVSLKHETEKCMFLDVVLNDNEIHYTGLSEVSFFGDATMLAHRILANLNRLYKGEQQWQIEVIGDSEAQNISLSDSNCWDAFSLFKSQLGLNFIFKGRKVTVGTVGKLIDHIFKYGSGNGLTEITRTAVSENAVVTRLRAYGGERNLPRDYNKTGLVPESQYIKSLMLPNYTTTLIDYIDSENIPIYGIREAVFKDENIYPSIHGVTADDLRAAGVATTATGRVDEIVAMEAIKRDDQATFNVWIKDIGFNIKKYLTPTTALLSMRDGNLGGYEFEIVNVIKDSSVAGAAYKLTINRNQDDNFILPDIKTFVKPGDHFVLLEIYMPEAYVKAAEQRLLTKAKKYLAEYDHVKATYSINMDKVFMAYHPTIGDTLYEGDLIRVVDEDLKLDREIIIQNLNIKTGGAVYEYDVTLSDNPVATTLDRVQDNVSEIEQNVTANRIDGVKEARRRAIELQLLKANIFDPDGEIKDTFLQTMMLQVGANSMNYQMGITTARPDLVNMSFTNTSINLGKDSLVHFAYGAGEEKASTWNIATPFVGSGLIAEKTYFVAIKASRDNLTAEWIVDENTFGSESVPGYYIFNFGILSEVIDGARLFSETRGNIYAYGDELTAGIISSINRYSYFNLNTGDFQLYNPKTGEGLQFKDGTMSFGNFNPETGKFSTSITKIENDIETTSQQAADAQSKANEADRKAQEAQEYITGTILPDLETLQAQVDGQVNSWFYAYSPTLSNYPASSWDTVLKKDAAIGDTFTNTQEFADNITTPDAGKSWRWIKEGATYKWTPIADSDAVKALAIAAKAEATADGKSTIHLLKPSIYGVGDAWILENDTVKPPYKKGEMLNAVRGNTVFNTNDWEKRDLSAGNAVDALQIGGVNIFNHSGNFVDTINNWHNNGGGLTIDTAVKYNGYNTIRTVVGAGIEGDWYNLENGVEYCYFSMIKTNGDIAGDGTIPIHYHAGKGNISQGKISITKFDTSFKAGEWKLGYIVFKLTEDADSFRPIIYIGTGTSIFNIAFLGLTKGNKPMASWSPSLADQQAETERIAQLKAEAERVKAEAYADGMVTIEEQRAIADTQAKYDAAVREAERIAQAEAQKALDEANKKPNTFAQIDMPGSARKNDTWYSGTTQADSLYAYACVTTYTGGGTMANWLLVADNTGTTIKNGLITTGTIYLKGGSVADKLQVRAGISGAGEANNSVRFWAGGTLAEANALVNNTSGTKATFAVTQGGKLYAANVEITGKITATSGEFTGKIQSSSNGNRIIIDSDSRKLSMINSSNNTVAHWGFETNGYSVIKFNDPSGAYSYLNGGVLRMYYSGFMFEAAANMLLHNNLPRGRTGDGHIQYLPSGAIFIDTGQESNNTGMLRVKY